MQSRQKKITLANRFRGLLPIIVDVETTGLNPATDGLLEIAAVSILMNQEGKLSRDQTFAYQVEPFVGANLDPNALEITGIDPGYPLRYAIPEAQALYRLFAHVEKLLVTHQCHRGVLVGHNAWFDLTFLQNAAKRSNITSVPFHSFTSFDTATLAAAFLGETVLAKAMRRANIAFDVTKAHSAIYDAERTAELFCYMVNRSSYR